MPMETKPSQYQGALKMLGAAVDALQHSISGVRRQDEPSVIRRRIEEVEGFLKKAKRELRIG